VKAAVAWRTGQSSAPPDTIRCACHVTWPLDSDRWSFCLLGHRTGTIQCPVRLPRHLAVGFRPLELLSSGPPDRHYSVSGAPSGSALTLEFSKVSSSELESLVHRTVRCARPGHTLADFCSLFLNPFSVFLLVCCEPLAPVELII
jgi:hypothetical protein